VVSVEDALARLKAALDARRDPDLVIVARTDVKAVAGFDAAIERSQLFMAAGADMAKPHGADTIEEIGRAIREIPGPHFATLSQAAGKAKVTLAELAAAGVSAVSFPSVALFAAAQAVARVMAALKRDNGLDGVLDELIPLDQYYELVGLKAQLAREEGYDTAARAILAQRAAE